MLSDRDRRWDPLRDPHPDPRGEAWGADGDDPRPGRERALRRFLGGAPAAVFLRLLFLSVLAGALMSTLGVTPGRLFRQAYGAARALAEAGLASLHDVGGWIAAGAAVVVPLWLIARLFAASR